MIMNEIQCVTLRYSGAVFSKYNIIGCS